MQNLYLKVKKGCNKIQAIYKTKVMFLFNIIIKALARQILFHMINKPVKLIKLFLMLRLKKKINHKKNNNFLYHRVFELPISYIFLLVGGEDGTNGISPVNIPIIIL